MTAVRIGLSVTTDDAMIVARAAEQFARTAAGLSLEGVECLVMTGPDDYLDEDGEPPPF